MNIEQVKEYIESEGLNGRSREQFYVFRRHYLCWALYRSQELTLGEVGKLLNRDHSTVLHSIRKHEELKTDRLYQKMTESCVQFMSEPLIFTKTKRDIFNDLARAKTYMKLRRVRRWLNEGKYDHQKSFQQEQQNTM